MEKNITIRQLTVDDWEVFKKIRLEAVKENSHSYLTNFDEESLKGDAYWIDTLHDHYNGTVFGIYHKGIAIGIMGAFRYRESKIDTVILGMAYIQNSYRGIKLSNYLYEASIGWAKEQDGIIRILISHRDDNKASESTIKKWGFNFLEKVKITYGDGTTDFSHRYELRIQ